MLKKIAAIAATLALVSGCQSLRSVNATAAQKAQDWWNSPQTQQGVQIGIQAAEAALIAAVEDALVQKTTSGNVGWTEVGKSAGSSALREIELTPAASQLMVAAARVGQAVIAASSDPAQAMAAQNAVIAGLSAAKATGADPSGALEGIAQALDSQGAVLPK